MKLKNTLIIFAIALGLGLSATQSMAQKRRPGFRAPPPRVVAPRRVRPRNNNVGIGVAGAIIGLAAGAIAADIARKNNRSTYRGAPQWCNVRACASRYRSFRAYDCTFQPYNGPRRYCRY